MDRFVCGAYFLQLLGPCRCKQITRETEAGDVIRLIVELESY
jgi:hypothetical protein